MEAVQTSPVTLDPPGTTPGKSSIWFERVGVGERLKREGSLLLLGLSAAALSAAMPALKSRGLWFDIPCLFNKITGLPCLTCGLTRSFSLTSHGDFTSAFRMHLLGPVLFVVLGLTIAYLAFSVFSGYRLRFRLSPRTRRLAFWAVLGIFFTCWVVKISFFKGTW